MPFARLLLLLTHHPDLQWDETGIKDIARLVARLTRSSGRNRADVMVLPRFIECIAQKENISLLFHIACKLKTVRDATDETNDVSDPIHSLHGILTD